MTTNKAILAKLDEMKAWKLSQFKDIQTAKPWPRNWKSKP